MNREELSYMDKYNEFWKDIVENEDGTLNKDQVMRELSDYSMVLDNCSDAYYAMTNGKISKQNTKFFEVENIFNNEFIDMKYYDKLQQQNKKYKEVIEKANKKLNDFIECCKAEKLESGSDYLHHQYWDMFERFNKQIKDILKEVE